MNIHSIWAVIFKFFRVKRFRFFLDQVRPTASDRILDIGGYPQTWLPHAPCAKEVHITNVHEIPHATETGGHHLTYGVADGRSMPQKDGSFDIVFSNSVIEHVGTWEDQKKFAAETRRLGQRLWIQTPAQEFWIEPHFMTPFIHWFSRETRIKLARNFSVWGWLTRPNREQATQFVDDIRLLTLEEMLELYPDCTILQEKFLGIFTKSYVAVRLAAVASSAVVAQEPAMAKAA